MKYAHLEKDTNKLLGWYADDVHCIWIDPVYEKKVIQEETKDDDGNITQEEVVENVLVKDGYYDISNIPTPNIEVDEEVWQEAISINANCYEDGKFIVKDFRTKEEIEEQRIAVIKNKAREVIEETYPAYKQHNILMSGIAADISSMNEYITNIRNISNEAETNGTTLEDIVWGV